jgi:ABC-type branched-subunit amino acid transport system ATPase component
MSGYISGGTQHLLSIGHALMAWLTVILLHKPTTGLASQLVEEI